MNDVSRFGYVSRRRFLAAGLAAGAVALGERNALLADESALPPVRTITHGPRFHWFGYYDKLEFDPSGRYVLSMQVDFQHRAPRPDDVIQVGMVDLHEGDRWIELGETRAWCWQQGCMLQWLPGSDSEVVWNDREEDHFVCRILDVKSKRLRTIPHPIYALSPDGTIAVSCDFSRLNDVRPGYGYVGIPDPAFDELAPASTGVFRVDLRTGKQELLFSLAKLAAFGKALPSMEGAKHKLNHLLFNPDGTRFAFLHRWKSDRQRETRMMTATPEGTDLRVVDDNGITSHFDWRDPGHILAFSRQPSHGMRFYVFEDGGARTIEPIGVDVMPVDGHCTYLPGNEWILNDTYPDEKGFQHPYVYHVASGKRIPLGHFPAPPEYSGEFRCDNHPRSSPDGRTVVIDAPEPKGGRQLHLIDISRIVG